MTAEKQSLEPCEAFLLAAAPPWLEPLIKQLGGEDAGGITLKATVGLLPAGKRDHWNGGVVSVFSPVALRLAFVEDSTGLTVATARYCGDEVRLREQEPSSLDAGAFDAQVRSDGRLADTTLRAATGLLMRKFIDNHREITGTVSAAYEHIETDQDEIARILRNHFELDISLKRLARHLALDEALLKSLSESAQPGAATRFELIAFERLKLKQGFIDQPCSLELFAELRQTYKDGGYAGGLEFIDYYRWFFNSEALFGASGQLEGETRDGMEKAIKAWHATGGDKPDFIESTRYWANRNFEIHPAHRNAVARFIDEVLATLPPPTASVTAPGR